MQKTNCMGEEELAAYICSFVLVGGGKMKFWGMEQQKLTIFCVEKVWK